MESIFASITVNSLSCVFVYFLLNSGFIINSLEKDIGIVQVATT